MESRGPAQGVHSKRLSSGWKSTRSEHAVIDTRLTMAFREKRLEPVHLLVGQLKKVAHLHPRQFGGLNQVGLATSSRTMGPEPRKNRGIGKGK